MADVVTRGAEREHRTFSPSKSERFFNCPGSTNLLARLPSRATSPYAEEGHVAHDVLEAGLRNGCTTAHEAIKHSVHADHPKTQGYTDFHHSIQDALDYVWNLMEELDIMYGDAVMFVERYVDVPSHTAPGETGGYCDVCIYSAIGRVLYVIDYKHGVGVAKAAEGNTQVKQYASGFLYEENAQINAADVDKVVLVIIQPRAFHPHGEIREYETTPLELSDYLFELEEAIEACQQPNAPLRPDISWCQFCDARSSCPALAQSAVAVILDDAQKAVQDVTDRTLIDPKELDVGRLAYVLKMKPLIMTWLNGVESHADELSRLGHEIPGFKRVEAQARREYYGNRDELAQKLAALIGCDINEVYREPALLTITDMEDKLVQAFKARVGRGKKKQAAEEAKQMFAYFTLKQSSGNTTLVPLEDKRPAINKAQLMFGGISGLIPPPTNEEKP